jgi:hypothetical protein
MKGRQHPANDRTLNTSHNESIRDVIARIDPSRRRILKTGVGAGALAAFGGVTLAGFVESVAAAARPVPASAGFAGIGFASVPPNLYNPATGLLHKDLVTVPDGYVARVLAAWGDPLVKGAPPWDVNATQDATAQALQVGMHHDGMYYFPFPGRSDSDNVEANRRGLLCVNHEYTDENQLHGAEGLTGGTGVTIAKVRKSQAAHGVSVMKSRTSRPPGATGASAPTRRTTVASPATRRSGCPVRPPAATCSRRGGTRSCRLTASTPARRPMAVPPSAR